MKRIFLLTTIAAWLAIVPLTGHAIELNYDFASGMGGDFTFTNPDGVFTLTATNGELQITKPVGSHASSVKAYISFKYQLVGDFDITVDYRLLTNLTEGDQVQFNISGGYANVRDYWGEVGGHNYHAWLANLPWQEAHDIAVANHHDTTDTSGSLRFVRNGDQVTSYYKSPGGSWTPIYNYNPYILGTGNTGLNMMLQQQPSSSTSIGVAFDNLHIWAEGIDGYPYTPSVINLYDSFPDNQGDNGFYALAYQAGRAQPYRLLTDTGYKSFHTPEQESGYWAIPYIHLETINSVNWINPHPSDSNAAVYGAEDSVLRWVVPAPNVYSLAGTFMYYSDAYSDGVNVYIKHNETVLWSSTLTTYGQTVNFNLPSISLPAGEFLHFGVNSRSNFNHDWTYLRGTISSAPTAVDLAFFRARPRKNKVLLRWQTRTETETAAFRLWRKRAKRKNVFRPNTSLIPAQGGPSQGADYAYRDLNVVPGRTYRYKLEEISRDGTSTFHGPVSARVPAME